MGKEIYLKVWSEGRKHIQCYVEYESGNHGWEYQKDLKSSRYNDKLAIVDSIDEIKKAIDDFVSAFADYDIPQDLAEQVYNAGEGSFEVFDMDADDWTTVIIKGLPVRTGNLKSQPRNKLVTESKLFESILNS